MYHWAMATATPLTNRHCSSGHSPGYATTARSVRQCIHELTSARLFLASASLGRASLGRASLVLRPELTTSAEGDLAHTTAGAPAVSTLLRLLPCTAHDRRARVHATAAAGPPAAARGRLVTAILLAITLLRDAVSTLLTVSLLLTIWLLATTTTTTTTGTSLSARLLRWLMLLMMIMLLRRRRLAIRHELR